MSSSIIALTPDQVDALKTLFVPGVIAVDVATDNFMGLRVAAYFADDNAADEDGTPVGARWYSISVAGKVREIAADPEPETRAAA